MLACTEIAVDTASSLTQQSKTFSNDNPLKALIGVAPCGLVTFISPLYTGSISDTDITRSSEVLSLLEPGDDIIADGGFDIQDLLDDVGARLIAAQFKRGVQLTKEETEKIQIQ
ncbi:hypothetical protein Q5P01_018623 [Channa striata]|uniref:DDE Tnp4 domain-containing protein n=1 Tax=Channa striata TaxID=64152 RepID=A0AA88SA08_CHASR|nr:hypothetical protein Q5P01_018623 [Channa striata]